jgi:phenylacetate-CoA ligase
VDTTVDDIRGVPQTVPFTSREEVASVQRSDPPWGGLLAVEPGECSLFGFSNAIAAGLPGHHPILLAVTAEDMRTRVEVAARGLSMGGSGPGDRTAIIGEVARSVLHHVLLGALAKTGSTPFQTGRGLTLRHVRHTLPSLAPTQVVTHPTYALFLARLMEEEGTTLPVDRLFLWGEMGPSVPTVRSMLTEAWGGAEIRDVYATEELGVLAVECEAGDGLHGFEDRFVYEVVDPVTDQTVGPGEVGELVVSTLHAEAMPLLRYRTGDLVTTEDAQCSCGRTHLRLHVLGRVVRMDDGTVRTFDLANVERLLGRSKALWGLYRIVVEEEGAMLEVPMAALDEGKQAVSINTALLAARSAGAELRPVEALPIFHHRATRVVRVEDVGPWETMAEEQRRLEL